MRIIPWILQNKSFKLVEKLYMDKELKFYFGDEGKILSLDCTNMRESIPDW